MTDIAVLILAGNEAIHISRCLRKLAPLEPRQIFIVESQTGDDTHAVALRTAAELGWPADGEPDGKHPCLRTVFRAWPGVHSLQLNWAIDNLPFDTTWVLRMDADEYLTDATIGNLKAAIANRTIPEDVHGLTLLLKRKFLGGDQRHWRSHIRLTRIWRRGYGHLESRAMDEHVAIDGKTVDFDGAFYDDNLNGFEWWREKHRGYARREAKDAVERFLKLPPGAKYEPDGVTPLSPGDRRKAKYYRLPPYLRAFAYFLKRYLLEGGILDGRAGWRWHFWQGLWYRWQCDREIGKLLRSRD